MSEVRYTGTECRSTGNEVIMLIEGKTAVVTGCNRGIGKAIMETFAANGADIIACTRKESAEYSEHINMLASKYRVRFTPVYFDLSEADNVIDAARMIIAMKRQIDILVNNAGVASGAYFQMTSIKELRKIFEINFFSQILFTQGITRYMSRFRSGSVINIASTAGLIGDVGMTSYGSSKAAFIFATKTMAAELGESTQAGGRSSLFHGRT